MYQKVSPSMIHCIVLYVCVALNDTWILNKDLFWGITCNYFVALHVVQKPQGGRRTQTQLKQCQNKYKKQWTTHGVWINLHRLMFGTIQKHVECDVCDNSHKLKLNYTWRDLVRLPSPTRINTSLVCLSVRTKRRIQSKRVFTRRNGSFSMIGLW